MRSLDDVSAVVDAGADALGINLIPASPRFVEEGAIDSLLAAAQGLDKVAVVADRAPEELQELLRRFPFDRVQLHGSESQQTLAELGAKFFKALRLGSRQDAQDALSWPGEPLLVDAKVPGQLGGTGQMVPEELVIDLARHRKIILAGGLTEDNVGQRIAVVRPHGVDVASGVESSPGVKDSRKIASFVGRAREAAESQ